MTKAAHIPTRWTAPTCYQIAEVALCTGTNTVCLLASPILELRNLVLLFVVSRYLDDISQNKIISIVAMVDEMVAHFPCPWKMLQKHAVLPKSITEIRGKRPLYVFICKPHIPEYFQMFNFEIRGVPRVKRGK